MIDFSKLYQSSGLTPADYWAGQELEPWKETGFGGGKVGMGAWGEAGFPIPEHYTAPTGTPYGDDVRATEVITPVEAQTGGADWKPSPVSPEPRWPEKMAAPSQFNYPEMPGVLTNVLEGAAPQAAIRGLWENFYSRPEYVNPEYTKYVEAGGLGPSRPYTEWEGSPATEWRPVARHMKEVFGWSPEDVDRVIGAWFGGEEEEEPDIPDIPDVPDVPDVPPGPPTPPGPRPPTTPTDVPPWTPPTFDYPPAEEGAPDTIYGGYPPEPPPFPYPSQWGEAGNIFSAFAGGMPTPLPPTWEYGEDLAAQMAETGLPTTPPDIWGEAAGRAREMGETGFETPAPEAWGQAETLAGEMGETGFRTPTPDVWGDVKGFGQGMMETGMPISSEDWYQQARTVAEMDIKDAIDMAKEQFGVAGLRASSPLYRTAGDISTRRMAELGTEFATRQTAALEAARGRQMGAAEQLFGVGAGEAGLAEAAAGRRAGAIPMLTDIGTQRAALTEAGAGRRAAAIPMMGELGAMEAGLGEAAAGRQLEALPQLFQYGAGEAALGESAKDRAMAAAQNLVGLGGQYFQAPLTVAQNALQAGLSLQQAQQQAISPLLQEFIRGTPEMSPWLQFAQGLTTMPFQMQPQQYQPSFFSQLLGMGAGLGSAALIGSSQDYKKDISVINEHEEDKIAKDIQTTPIFKYRYKFEPESMSKHIGLIAEQAPKEMTFFNDKMVGLYEYIGTLHATIKSLMRRIEKIE